jgi:GT2 family glycosyltransferase
MSADGAMAQADGAGEGGAGPPGSPAPPVLSILVVSYNTREMTLDCLRSVVAETRTPHELIVVDNASPDGSAAAIAAEFPGIRLIASPENLGFAEGNNVAARAARGEYLLLLNPDTLVLRGALDSLVAFARAHPAAGIWGGRTLFPDGSLNPPSCWRRLDLWAILMRATGLASVFRKSPVFNAEGYGGWQRDRAREVDIVTGCLFLIRRADWQRLGGFDPTFVMYGEEADICRRAQGLGFRPMITPEAEIVHFGGASESVRADKLVRLYRALTTLIRRHFPPWQRPLARGLLAAVPLGRVLALSALRPIGLDRPASRAAWSEVWERRAEWRDGYPDRSGNG